MIEVERSIEALSTFRNSNIAVVPKVHVLKFVGLESKASSREKIVRVSGLNKFVDLSSAHEMFEHSQEYKNYHERVFGIAKMKPNLNYVWMCDHRLLHVQSQLRLRKITRYSWYTNECGKTLMKQRDWKNVSKVGDTKKNQAGASRILLPQAMSWMESVTKDQEKRERGYWEYSYWGSEKMIMIHDIESAFVYAFEFKPKVVEDTEVICT